MFTLNISCAVCKESFKNSDSIYTTSCGHVFHFHCVNQWRSRSSSCPQCRGYNPDSHRIYFNFDETHDYETVVNDLKAKLKNSDDKVTDLSAKLKNSDDKVKKLKNEITKKEKKIDDIQRLYNVSEQWRTEFQDKVQNLSKENEKLKKKNNLLITNNDTIQNISKFEKENINQIVEEQKQTISKLMAENLKLNEKINESETTKMILDYKVEMLEQRLKHLTLELKKQIAKNINRTVDNLSQTVPSKNQSNHNEDNLQDNQNEVFNEPNQSSPNEYNLQDSQNEVFNEPKPDETHTLNIKNQIAENVKRSTDNLTSAVPVRHTLKQHLENRRKFVLAQPNDSKVIIKEFPRKDLVYPLKYTIILLASKMSIPLTIDNISNVSTIDSKTYSNKITILVEFKTINIKMEFLSNRNRLNSHVSTKSIQIKEYIDENINPIFMYANQNLRSIGYEYVCCKGNQVFAKKSFNDIEEIAIKNRGGVDKLLGRTISRNRPAFSNIRLARKQPRGISRTYAAKSPISCDDDCYDDFFFWFE